VLDSGRFMRHTELIRGRLARMRRDARTALESAGLTFEEPPGEGIFLWCRVPRPLDMDELVRRARDESILLAKGSLFSPLRADNQRLRFNVAHSAAPELVRFLTDSMRAAA
jgi:DNA-binding transcriptional MocR family regulator